VLALALALVSGEASGLLTQATVIVQRGYSRRAEAHADRAAVAALVAHYGHAGGAAETFEILAREARGTKGDIPSFLATHPADDERIAVLRRAAAVWDPARRPLAPLVHATP
jgi:predicted Zn-dependent protease